MLLSKYNNGLDSISNFNRKLDDSLHNKFNRNVIIIISIESNFVEKLGYNEEEKLNQTKTLLNFY